VLNPIYSAGLIAKPAAVESGRIKGPWTPPIPVDCGLRLP
jgi:hypothetical protein